MDLNSALRQQRHSWPDAKTAPSKSMVSPQLGLVTAPMSPLDPPDFPLPALIAHTTSHPPANTPMTLFQPLMSPALGSLPPMFPAVPLASSELEPFRILPSGRPPLIPTAVSGMVKFAASSLIDSTSYGPVPPIIPAAAMQVGFLPSIRPVNSNNATLLPETASTPAAPEVVKETLQSLAEISLKKPQLPLPRPRPERSRATATHISEHRREQNRQASFRYRSRQLERISELQDQIAGLVEHQQSLGIQEEMLQREITQLHHLIRQCQQATGESPGAF